jgi:choline dehydrogenase
MSIHSRGRIALRSADPTAKPIIDPRYLSDSGGIDRAAIMEGLRVCARATDLIADTNSGRPSGSR